MKKFDFKKFDKFVMAFSSGDKERADKILEEISKNYSLDKVEFEQLSFLD